MSPAEEAAHPLSDTQIADNAVKTLKQFQARGLNTPFFLACGFRTCRILNQLSHSLNHLNCDTPCLTLQIAHIYLSSLQPQSSTCTQKLR